MILMASAFVAGVVGPSMHQTLPWDTMEGFLLGRSFQLGYAKHGPLLAWIAGATERIAPGQWWLAFVWAQVCVAVTIAAVWKLASSLLGSCLGALAAALTLAGIYCYSEPSGTLTADQLSMPMWALTLLFYWRAVGEGRPNYWYALAATVALALHAKYVIALLAAVLALLTISTREGRRALQSPAPWLAAVLGMVLIAPHLSWLMDHPSPIKYPLERLAAHSTAERIWFALKFAVAQLLNHLPLAALLAILFTPAGGGPQVTVERPPLGSFAWRFIVAAAALPLTLVVIFNLWAGVEFRHGWGLPMFPASAILAIALAGRRVMLRRVATTALCALLFVTIPHVGNGVLPYVSTTPRTASFPGREAAALLTAEYRSRTGRPLRIVVGDRFLGGAVALYSPDRPLLFNDASFEIAPWITPQMLQTEGALIVWPSHVPLTAIFHDRIDPSKLAVTGQVVLFWAQRPLSIAWAIMPVS